MLTLSVVDGRSMLGIGSGPPAYITEFSDRVGEEKPQDPPARFRPTAARVSEMDKS